jgi:stage II sporulation protein P
MQKRFKTKKKRNYLKSLFIFIVVLFLSFLFIFNVLYNNVLIKIDNEKLINYLIDYNLNTNNDSTLDDILNLNSTEFILKYSLGLEIKSEIDSDVISEDASYIEDPYETEEVGSPIIYIYNTHQTEGYQKSNNASYNITPSVLMASYILRETLNDLNVSSMVETNDITEILRINNWQYKYSYQASRILVEDAKSKNPSLTYFIDLHRDSMNYDITTTTIDNKKYAKILFVIGRDYEGYEKNLSLANSLNDYIKTNYPTLTRGVSIKGGSGVNGIYNQDISNNAILIELGGQYNTITEVNNTIKILAEAIHYYVGENI